MIKYIKKYKYLLTIILIILLLVISIITKKNLQKTNTKEITPFPVAKEESLTPINNPKQYAEIKGAVVTPGVYPIEENNRVIDIINKSGGLTEEADLSLINQSKIVDDQDIIIIYTKEEVANATKELDPIIKIVEKECICPEIKNDGCLPDKNTNTSNKASDDTSLININTATLEQLMTLNGIGESKAKSIIEYRDTQGPFTTIEDITKVSGIGETVYAKIKDHITT